MYVYIGLQTAWVQQERASASSWLSKLKVTFLKRLSPLILPFRNLRTYTNFHQPLLPHFLEGMDQTCASLWQQASGSFHPVRCHKAYLLTKPWALPCSALCITDNLSSNITFLEMQKRQSLPEVFAWFPGIKSIYLLLETKSIWGLFDGFS